MKGTIGILGGMVLYFSGAHKRGHVRTRSHASPDRALHSRRVVFERSFVVNIAKAREECESGQSG